MKTTYDPVNIPDELRSCPSWHVVTAEAIILGPWGLGRAKREAAKRPGSRLAPSDTVTMVNV